MHIPDGVLDVKTIVTTSVLGAAALAYSGYKVRAELTVEKVKQMAVVGAFIFAAQMINVPINDGTSGHLLGAALAAILLGPWLGTLTLSFVLVVQSVIFGDGGILALGANILCAGVVATMTSYAVQTLLKARVHTIAISLVAGWLSILAGASAIALTLLSSNSLEFMNVMTAMTVVHSQIGILEAVLTAGVVFIVTYNVKEKNIVSVER